MTNVPLPYSPTVNLWDERSRGKSVRGPKPTERLKRDSVLKSHLG